MLFSLFMKRGKRCKFDGNEYEERCTLIAPSNPPRVAVESLLKRERGERLSQRGGALPVP